MGFEPTRPVRGDRVSTATRPAVSGSRPYFEPVEPRGVEPRRRVCKTQLPPASDPVVSGQWAVADGTRSSCPPPTLHCPLPSDRSGSRTHTGQALDLPALPVGLPGHNVSRGAWDSNPAARAYETRLSACPPAKQSVADLRVELSIRAYETQPGAGPSAMRRVVTVGFEPTLSTF